ncbi:hypothetical protein GGR52DRAFT_530170 [Hypoxylon sp. FL1284]|nr:hypothetical protein GGR52DRAFT_530170 [Hypoxylon sp. FL1284]
MARRSARIASATKRTTASPAPGLGALDERDEHPEIRTETTRTLNTIQSSPMPHPATPSVATPVKLPMSEMHPSKVHATTAAPSSGLKLGFVDIDYTKDPAQRAAGVYQSTPSKSRVPSSDFTFRIPQPNGNTGLGPEAQKMMDALRSDSNTLKIKAQLKAEREKEKLEEALASDGRKIRQPKGKAGRYSAIHMAEFKKMDSIENHPSAFRATPGRVTPGKQGLKRTQSKANLDETGSVRSKKSSNRAMPASPEKHQGRSESPAKRAKESLDDDVSLLRPVSRDGSFIPRPKSSGNDSAQTAAPRTQTVSHLMTPTKSSLARVNSSAKASTVSLVKTPSRPELRKPNPVGHKTEGGTKLPHDGNLGVPAHVQTPGRFDRVKSILKRQISGSKSRFKSHIPQIPASPSKTSLHLDADKELPPPPLTTPGRKLQRHVGFTPMAKQAALSQNSPSPVKSGIPRAKAVPRLQLGSPAKGKSTDGKTPEGEVAYPDLSAYCRDIDEQTEKSSDGQQPQSVPGTFTFRSDHTISFDAVSPKGFGGASGQASVRQVRESSMMPTAKMPGSFPRASEASPNKENQEPAVELGIPHGMSNKKRHRASWDEEEDVADQHAVKKFRTGTSVEGHALVAPRLVGADSPTKKLSGSQTPSPKKKSGISLSRLNMLARPKARK